MKKYRIKFNLKDGQWLIWERFGKAMEATLKHTKQAISKEFGDEWTGGIAICGDQGNGIYCF